MDDRTHRDLVLRFLERTVAYADASIQRKLERGESATTIDPWRHHRDFTSRAIDELRAGHLDAWLERSDPSWVPQPTGRGDHDLERIEMDLNALSHAVRGTLLSGLISPRPTLLIGTHGPEGGGNLAPVSSLSIVSNHPPIATVSFGVNREGRPRDTWANLQDRPEGLLHVLPATPDAAARVADANAPLPRSESEWTAIDLDSMEHPSGLRSRSWPWRRSNSNSSTRYVLPRPRPRWPSSPCAVSTCPAGYVTHSSREMARMSSLPWGTGGWCLPPGPELGNDTGEPLS